MSLIRRCPCISQTKFGTCIKTGNSRTSGQTIAITRFPVYSFQIPVSLLTYQRWPSPRALCHRRFSPLEWRDCWEWLWVRILYRSSQLVWGSLRRHRRSGWHPNAMRTKFVRDVEKQKIELISPTLDPKQICTQLRYAGFEETNSHPFKIPMYPRTISNSWGSVAVSASGPAGADEYPAARAEIVSSVPPHKNSTVSDNWAATVGATLQNVRSNKALGSLWCDEEEKNVCLHLLGPWLLLEDRVQQWPPTMTHHQHQIRYRTSDGSVPGSEDSREENAMTSEYPRQSCAISSNFCHCSRWGRVCRSLDKTSPAGTLPDSLPNPLQTRSSSVRTNRTATWDPTSSPSFPSQTCPRGLWLDALVALRGSKRHPSPPQSLQSWQHLSIWSSRFAMLRAETQKEPDVTTANNGQILNESVGCTKHEPHFHHWTSVIFAFACRMHLRAEFCEMSLRWRSQKQELWFFGCCPLLLFHKRSLAKMRKFSPRASGIASKLVQILPPTRFLASRTVTLWPSFTSFRAAPMPEIPAPTMITVAVLHGSNNLRVTSSARTIFMLMETMQGFEEH